MFPIIGNPSLAALHATMVFQQSDLDRHSADLFCKKIFELNANMQLLVPRDVGQLWLQHLNSYPDASASDLVAMYNFKNSREIEVASRATVLAPSGMLQVIPIPAIDVRNERPDLTKLILKEFNDLPRPSRWPMSYDEYRTENKSSDQKLILEAIKNIVKYFRFKYSLQEIKEDLLSYVGIDISFNTIDSIESHLPPPNDLISIAAQQKLIDDLDQKIREVFQNIALPKERTRYVDYLKSKDKDFPSTFKPKLVKVMNSSPLLRSKFKLNRIAEITNIQISQAAWVYIKDGRNAPVDRKRKTPDAATSDLPDRSVRQHRLV